MKKNLVIALPKGRIQEESMKIFEKIGFGCRDMFSGSRKLIFPLQEQPVTFMIVRAQDVPTYVHHGAADVGICGKDTIEESTCDLYEPLDLGFGGCDVVVAEPKGYSTENPGYNGTIVGTKMVNVAERFFASKGVDVEIIKLYGSIELAPLVGLAHRVVDIVETGETLRQNGLEVKEVIFRSTCRVITNRNSMKNRHAQIEKLLADMAGQL
ncbi:ATP phosphoribosyltransferase [Desulfurispirillum indicum S5]|uniref:ATP phosphoribosyltransferase n=1 Tax=Desulfurispirillum indicum (strain ATCC BAA-1389 / DSM 22839 / S5) TaxID=653733 RepID=E6W6N1_DESIS|nr:ATP phosphoribosyltransferase [Desulfurispirillum indicum]ADU65031.1 ATP phosphoribosyltransferase [Desulfurispirillum indicum S5]